MKCHVCNHEGEILYYYEKEDGEKFVPFELHQINGCSVAIGRVGLNTEYKLFGCPKCGSIKFE